jgi:hypothetical protein
MSPCEVWAVSRTPSGTLNRGLHLNVVVVIHPKRIFRFGSIQVNLRQAEVFRNSQPVVLAARELKLLRYFIEHRGATLSRERIAQPRVGIKNCSAACGHIARHPPPGAWIFMWPGLGRSWKIIPSTRSGYKRSAGLDTSLRGSGRDRLSWFRFRSPWRRFPT